MYSLIPGVNGCVESLGDGRVHAVLEGDEHQRDKLLEHIKQGPMASEVRDVKVIEIGHSGHRSFEVR